MHTVQTLPAHEALLEVVGEGALSAPEIVVAIRKSGRAEMSGYFAALAVQVHLDQLVAWGLLDLAGDSYSVAPS